MEFISSSFVRKMMWLINTWKELWPPLPSLAPSFHSIKSWSIPFLSNAHKVCAWKELARWNNFTESHLSHLDPHPLFIALAGTSKGWLALSAAIGRALALSKYSIPVRALRISQPLYNTIVELSKANPLSRAGAKNFFSKRRVGEDSFFLEACSFRSTSKDYPFLAGRSKSLRRLQIESRSN